MTAGLNTSQRAAAQERGHCIIAAGPGSGKTYTLVQKVKMLLDEGSAPDRIMLVAFNRDAALEIQSRVKEAAGRLRGSAVRVGTFHSLAMKCLVKGGVRITIPSGVQVRHLVRKIVQKMNLKEVSAHEAKEIIDALKVAGKAPEDADEWKVELVEEYNREMRKRGWFDFTDLLREHMDRVEDGRLNVWELDHIMADEYQDVDPLQHKWLRMHVDAGAVMTVVGDDDQSIYGWRYAMGYGGMEELREEYDAKIISLDVNYRCPQRLVEVAAEIIKENKKRIPKNIRSGAEGDCRIKWGTVAGRREEAEAIVEVASECNLAILARTRAYLDEIEVELIRRGVEYARRDGPSILSKAIFQDFRSIADVVATGSHDAIGEVLKRCGFNRAAWRMDAVRAGLDPDPVELFVGGVPAECELMHPVVELARKIGEWRRVQAVHWRMAIRGIVDWLSEHYDEQSVGDLDRVIQSLAGPEVMGIEGQLGALEALIVAACTGQGGHSAGVILTTLHQSKGQSYDAVWIPGIADGHFPAPGGEPEEERRLLYVGMTRARKAVYITALQARNETLFHHELDREVERSTSWR